MAKNKYSPLNVSKQAAAVIGIVLVWRGLWYLLDKVDVWLFGGNSDSIYIISIVAGLLLLYLSERDLRDL